jgi:signal transduction histidine kinase/ActR/RegA family two-component response regulator
MWASLSAGHRMLKTDKHLEPELENRIRAEQVRSAYNSTSPGIMATAVAAMLVAGILVGVDAIGVPLAIAFGGFMLIQVQARLLLISSYRQHQPPDHEWREWSRRFSVGVLVAGLGVGGFAVLMLPPARLDLQLLIMLYVCAVASGAITAYGVLRPAIYAILPILLLPAGWMAFQGDWLHWALAFIILGWLVAITEQARRISAQFVESVRLRFENEELIARLTQEKIVAEEASSAKSRFLAAASHDLRQPVHALSLFAAAMRPRVTDPEAVRMLDHIDTSVQAMGGLFNGLLDISRLDAGVVEVNAEAFAIHPLLERICRDNASQAEAKHVELRLRPSRAAVFSDPLLMERVVRNIVANAIAYTDRGKVLVGCRRRGRSLIVQVWDTGRGIAPDEQARIFQEFYQVGNSERDRGRGVGLGLAIVKRLTALLNHPLSLRSTVGRGSVFSITLPYSDAIPATGAAAGAAASALQGPALVLVIDDELRIQVAMRNLLQGWGFDVVTASSGDALMSELANRPERPALIISDYRLRAEENGIQVIERLRSEYNDDEMPAMLITGDTAPNRLKEAQDSGLLLLHKPVSDSRLRAAIAHLMSRPAHHAETSPPASG